MKLKIIYTDEICKFAIEPEREGMHACFNAYAFHVITDTCALVNINFTETVKTNS